jgi:FkbM family methyltransferase
MLDLPQEVIEQINGKDIIDIGSWPGDTIFTFHKYFPKSNIYAYEPVAKQMDEIKSFIEQMKQEEPNLDGIYLIQKGLSDKDETKAICFKDCDEKAVITKLDTEYKLMERNNLGLIKMDPEGYE